MKHGSCLHMVMYGSQDIAPTCLMDCAQTRLLTSQMLHLTHHHLQLAEACPLQIHLNRLPLTLQKLHAPSLHPLQHSLYLQLSCAWHAAAAVNTGRVTLRKLYTTGKPNTRMQHEQHQQNMSVTAHCIYDAGTLSSSAHTESMGFEVQSMKVTTYMPVSEV